MFKFKSKTFVLVVGLVVLAMALAACSPGSTTEVQPGESMGEDMDDHEANAGADPSVSVSAQDISGGTLIIDDVVAAQPGWIVIHVTKDGAPGPVIGFASVDEGENHGVEVEIDLDQATGQLFAMLHLDAGTLGTYEFPGDDVPVRVDDTVVNVPFDVTFPIEPAVTVSDQDISEGTATIEKVSAVESGWIVIHAASEGKPGPVVGFAPVGIGNNAQVQVEIDLSKATRQLFAMLHLDAGTLGEYEFPGDDVPVRVDDAVVNVPFEAAFAVEPGVSVSDQDFSGGIVTLDNVAYDAPGWLVIHVENDGAPGPVIGFAPVAAGNNPGLQVEIDAGAATPRLFAMLHLDAGVIGEYEFPGDDVPVRVGDAVVVVPFNQLDALAAESVEKRVSVEDSRFNLKEITVQVGTTVVWKMGASLPHTVTADDGSFNSGTLRDGDTFSFTFDTPGTYAYYCSFHGGPGGNGMSGVVTVTG